MINKRRFPKIDMTISRILKSKGTHAAFVSPDAKIADVIAELESEDVGALVISADGQSIDGIISERDIVRGLQEFGHSVLDHEVCDLMTKDVFTCTSSDFIAGIMAAMHDRGIRHVPVVDNGELAGIVSIRDIVKLRLDEVLAEAEAMRAYINCG